MYGETHVAPAQLFDATVGRPPTDALDLYFSVPTSLSLLGDALARTPDMAHLLSKLAQVYSDVLGSTVVKLQRSCGYVEHPTLGKKTPARLAITARSENSVPGEALMRIHGHVYVGRSATALHDGQEWPVNEARLRRVVDDVWITYLDRLVIATSEALSLSWGPLPGHHPGDKEIVEPPFAPHVREHRPVEQVQCPGQYGPLTQIVADQQWRIGVTESQIRLDAERRRAG
jgi:hypothetical protein